MGVLLALTAGGASLAAQLPHPFLEQHCFNCHEGEDRKGGLDLSTLATDLNRPDLAAKWVRIHDRIAAGEMPPPKRKSQPTPEEKSSYLATLAKSLTEADLAAKGVLIRRLTRVEYENTVRDLLGVHTEIQGLLPEDGKAHGFDKISEALPLSSTHLERYMEAAGKALREALSKGPRPETRRQTLEVSVGVVMPKELERARVPLPDGSLVFFGDGGFPTYMVPVDSSVAGRYRFKLTGRAHQSSDAIAFKLAAGKFGRGNIWRDLGMQQLPPEGGVVEIEVWLFEGEKLRIFPQVGPGFQMWRAQNRMKPSVEYPGPGLSVQPVECEGPLIDQWPSQGHQLLFGKFEATAVVAPSQAKGGLPGSGPAGNFAGKGRFSSGQNHYIITSAQPKADARRLLENFMPVAVRRPTNPDTVELYVRLAHAQLDAGATFEEAMLTAYTAVLAAPDFLFLRENAGRLDDYALAARLSYFLWSTAPDGALIAAAAKGGLSQPDRLRAQTERMLRDPKARRFTENFTGQWLGLREIEATTPDKQVYPEFDAELQVAMVGETRAFFDEILSGNLSTANFIDSDWTMVNSRLAKFYGIDGVQGAGFRKVALAPGHHRGGVLTHASLLKVTANGTHTSPIKRGAWVLDRILGTPPPPPPPSVPGVEPDTRGSVTLRQQLEQHRNLESCNGCHRHIDPPGFALENYDAIGGWRENYRVQLGTPAAGAGAARNRARPQWKPGLPVDATGVTPDDRPFTNITEYKRLLAEKPERFTRALAGQVAAYATGRGMSFSDRPELDRIAALVSERGHGFRDLLHEIVQSEIFKTK